MKLLIASIVALCILHNGPLMAQQASTKADLSVLNMEEDSGDQELLDKMKSRRQMLNWHKYSAWAAVGLMGATLATAPEGNFDNTHKWLGIAAGAAYLGSASLAYLAPEIDDSKLATNILIHKRLALVHAPAMLLTAYSGIKAHQDRKDEKQLSSIAKMHSAFAAIATVSFGLAAVSSLDWSMNIIPTGNKEVACLFTKSF